MLIFKASGPIHSPSVGFKGDVICLMKLKSAAGQPRQTEDSWIGFVKLNILNMRTQSILDTATTLCFQNECGDTIPLPIAIWEPLINPEYRSEPPGMFRHIWPLIFSVPFPSPSSPTLHRETGVTRCVLRCCRHVLCPSRPPYWNSLVPGRHLPTPVPPDSFVHLSSPHWGLYNYVRKSTSASSVLTGGR